MQPNPRSGLIVQVLSVSVAAFLIAFPFSPPDKMVLPTGGITPTPSSDLTCHLPNCLLLSAFPSLVSGQFFKMQSCHLPPVSRRRIDFSPKASQLLHPEVALPLSILSLPPKGSSFFLLPQLP